MYTVEVTGVKGVFGNKGIRIAGVADHQHTHILGGAAGDVYKRQSLCRVSIGSLHLDSLNLKPGEWAPIRPDAL